MATNGVNGTAKGSDSCQWKVGLLNHEGKYLTVEKFNYKMCISKVAFKTKQLWTVEHHPTKDGIVFLKNHLGKYLSGNNKGVASGDNADTTDDTEFEIVYQPDGRWAFKSRHNLYFSASGETLHCDAKQVTAAEMWSVQLAVHPQLNMRSVSRQNYGRLLGDQLQFDERIPWGQDALLTLQYMDGRYAVKSFDNRYLERSGQLVNDPNRDTLFMLQIRRLGNVTGMALKDSAGKFLTTVGTSAVMQSRKETVGKDELFTIEDSHAQAYFLAHNGKMVSIKQGEDVRANQDELTDTEIFQVEYVPTSKKWRFRTKDNKFWGRMPQTNGIQAVSESGNILMDLEYFPNGHIAIKADNGCYITSKMNGSLVASQDDAKERELFFLVIMNRPILVLRCEHGFVGFKGNTGKMECNRSSYDVLHTEHELIDDETYGKKSVYYISGDSGNYLAIDKDGGISAEGRQKEPFMFELSGQSRFYIKAPNGNFLKGEQNGLMQPVATSRGGATLWEF